MSALRMGAEVRVAACIASCMLLVLPSATACSKTSASSVEPSGPERVVWGYIAAVNAGDCQEALEHISPDRRWGFWSYDLGQPRSCRSRKVTKYHNIQSTLVRDSQRFPGCKEVSVTADKIKWNGAYQAREGLFVTERIEGVWYIRSASW